MGNRITQAILGLLVLLVCTPQVRGQESLQLDDHRRWLSASKITEPAAESGSVDSLAEWWGRHKRALQYLSACALASASISYAFIVGIGNPVGGALLGLLGAGIMVAICL